MTKQDEQYLEKVHELIEEQGYDPHELTSEQILDLQGEMTEQEAADYLISEFLQELE